LMVAVVSDDDGGYCIVQSSDGGDGGWLTDLHHLLCGIQVVTK